MTSIIEELNNKWNQEESIHVANMSVNGILYTINVGKLTKEEGYGERVDNNINLYCMMPSGDGQWTQENLRELFKDFYLIPVDGKLEVETTSSDHSKQLDCDQVEFSIIDFDNVNNAICTPINWTIIKQIQGLQTADASVDIAKVRIDNENYTIKFKKLDSGDNTAEISGQEITISSDTVPADSQVLSDLIGGYYVQKSAGKLKIDSEQDNAKKLGECL